jgi:aquaporin Z
MELSSSASISVFDSLRRRMMMPEPWSFREASEFSSRWDAQVIDALKSHWPEYLAEAAELGLFMVSACAFTVLLFHPSSPAVQSIASATMRRVLMGLAMGTTAIAIVFSPLGKRSGAHFNPAITLAYLRLGKIATADAAYYLLFQFIGGIAGIQLASFIFGMPLRHAMVQFAVTVPGPKGTAPAFFAELTITFILMSVVLLVSNKPRLGRWTGLFAGGLVAIYISLEAPLSGMSMNPARTLGSAVGAHLWTSLWIYFTAPPLGMLLAGEVYRRVWGSEAVKCAKLHHHNNQRCIFRCNYQG